MFTPTAEQYNLLTLSKTTDVMSTYEPEIQSGIVSLLCRQFGNIHIPIETHITSAEHFHFVMEIFGAGLKLKLNHTNLVHLCIDIYTKMFVEKTHLPQVITDNYDYYLERVCYQMSNVFHHVPATQEQKIYEVQCLKVIQFYQKIYINDIRHKKNEDNFVRLLLMIFCDVSI